MKHRGMIGRTMLIMFLFSIGLFLLPALVVRAAPLPPERAIELPLAAPAATGGITVCSQPNLAIPDNDPTGVTDTITISTSETIADVNIYIRQRHTWVGDLAFRVGYDGATATLIDRPHTDGTPGDPGCSGSDIDNIVDDEGTENAENRCTVNTPAYPAGARLIPNEPLSIFDGGTATGTWTLNVADFLGADTGTLEEWCVIINDPNEGFPGIEIDPAEFNEGHSIPPQTTTDTLTITNTGTTTLTWSLYEDGTRPVEVTGKLPPAPEADSRFALSNDAVPATRFYESGSTARDNLTGTVTLAVDDGSVENSIGLMDGGSFLWVNHFTPNPGVYPIQLTELQLLTQEFVGCEPTDLVDLYVWEDTDGDPANGATLVGSVVGQEVGTLGAFNSYPISLTVEGPGDILVGAVNRTCDISPASYYPAAIDFTGSQQRSWVGVYTDNVPANPPVLPADSFWGTIDEAGFPGNWMLRAVGIGSGDPICESPVSLPWLSLSPETGATAPATAETVTLTFDSTGLADGTYNGTLCLESNDESRPILYVPVALEVDGAPPVPTPTPNPIMPPDIYWEGDGVHHTHDSPPSQSTESVMVENQGTLPLHWEFAAGAGCSLPGEPEWLSVSPTSGTAGGQSGNGVTFTLDSTGLAEGTHSATLCIASNDPNQPLQPLPVSLTVSSPTAIGTALSEAAGSEGNLWGVVVIGVGVLAGIALNWRTRQRH